ncbi:hypothetical protein PILCRDRAFT_828512 [Piloderma croceum F 1598]|uniref:DUF7330 domain-containing protein n=1 Tax=Piloderma croceum (strain F 1598) TaxID=765440 RepID=A0A0C3AJV5_PILCF|nr:hypothetical protein PILCRDRAFT_828512 [Piloderma croceum F 1598]
MLIIPDNSPDHGKAAEAKAEYTEEPAFDPPPTYASSSLASSTTSPSPLAPKSQSTNYISLNRPNNSIKGVYTINPFLFIPQTFLPPLSPGETESSRKNLKIYSENGSVNVDITLLADPQKLGSEEVDLKKRATLDVASHNGSVNVKQRRVDTHTLGIRNPFHLNVTGHNGSVTVGIPGTFEGLITIHAKNGSVKISDDITQRIGMQNEVKHTHYCFVGDISLYNDGDASWEGDRLEVDAHNGRVKVYTIDGDPEASKGKQSLLSRILGTS